ncbi:hypothetical protein NKG94_28065 [Micromonospora sp. M12]
MVVDSALGLRTGSPVTVLTAVGPEAYTVSGLVDGPGVHVADEVAAALAPGVRAIGLVLAPDADPERVAAAARGVIGGDGRVLTGDARGALEPRDDARTRWIGMQVLTATAALAGFVTIFVVASTFAFTIAQRRRELGLLRAVGATHVRYAAWCTSRRSSSARRPGSSVSWWARCSPAPGSAARRRRVRAGDLPGPLRTLADRGLTRRRSGDRAAGRLVGVPSSGTGPPVEALREAAVEQRPVGRLRGTVGRCSSPRGRPQCGDGDRRRGSDRSQYALYAVMALVAGATVLAPAVVGPVVRLLRSPVRRPGGAIGMLVRGGR